MPPDLPIHSIHNVVIFMVGVSKITMQPHENVAIAALLLNRCWNPACGQAYNCAVLQFALWRALQQADVSIAGRVVVGMVEGTHGLTYFESTAL
jgi:hypothetical protein